MNAPGRSVAAVDHQIDLADSVSAFMLDLADAALSAGDFESCLRYTHVAATVLSRQNRTLFSPRVEGHLRAVSAGLFESVSATPAAQLPFRRPGGRATSLHVLSEALPAGGLTAMASRWISADAERTQGHVALLSEEMLPPKRLEDAVRRAGGTLNIVPAGLSLIEQARWLRELAHRVADHVVLHIDVSDVVCGSAFGSPGGPPVILVNQNAHLFWTGVSCADRIANCRGSVLEAHWTSTLRAAPRVCFVPIPIESPASVDSALGSDLDRQSRRDAWRARNAIPGSAVVMVSVGARFKYFGIPGSDFVDTFKSVLLDHPEAYLVVVGFEADVRWAGARVATGGRIRLLGRLAAEELHDVYLAADLYVEGFPFGTTTALLEAASAGVACVLAPPNCPPPYATDGAAVDGVIPRQTSLADYLQHLHHLLGDETLRRENAARIRESVQAHHVDEGWQRHLATSLSGMPQAHAVYECCAPPRTPQSAYEHWARFSTAWTWPFAETLEHAIVRALTLDLVPRIEGGARDSLSRALRTFAGSHMPLWLIALLCNHVLPMLSTRTRLRTFRALSFAARPGLMARTRERFWHGRSAHAGAYSEYRVEARMSFVNDRSERPFDNRQDSRVRQSRSKDQTLLSP